jgi:NitT/TauT family transport system permease protein
MASSPPASSPAPVAATPTPPAPRRRGPAIFGIRSRLTPQVDMLIGLLGTVALVAIWCFVTYGNHVRPLFLPSPTGIWEGLMELHQKGWLFPAIMRSSMRVAQSLLIVICIGVPIGILMGTFSPIDALLRKVVNGAKSIPTTGLVGLIVLWFSIEERAKIVFLVLGAIFYMIVLVKNAILSVNEEYVRVAVDIGASRMQTIQRVLLPAALPQIWDAIAVCSGIMWTYIVLAEYINSNQENLGLGYLLSVGSRTNESGQVFGTLIVIALVSSLTDWLLNSFRKRFLNW